MGVATAGLVSAGAHLRAGRARYRWVAEERIEVSGAHEHAAARAFAADEANARQALVGDHGPDGGDTNGKPPCELLGTGDFFGEGCLTGQPLRLATVSAMTECVIVQIAKADITRVIHEEPAFAELFISHLLARNSRVLSTSAVVWIRQFTAQGTATYPCGPVGWQYLNK
jgi:CRP-like cAMP-binding protein